MPCETGAENSEITQGTIRTIIDMLNLEGKGYVSWSTFKEGTIVLCKENENALDILKKYGPVMAGCPAGDFLSQKLPAELGIPGHLVTYSSWTNQLLNYVSDDDCTSDFMVGLIGRGNRDQDSINVELLYEGNI